MTRKQNSENLSPLRPSTSWGLRNARTQDLQNLFSSSSRPVLVLLSGGSAFDLLRKIDIENFGKHITIGVLDERFSTDEKVNNFAQLTATEFYRRAQEKGVHFIDTRIKEGETLEGLVKRFEKALREWKEENPVGTVIITQGIGTDGHTAGIMPHFENPEMFDDPDIWVLGYDAKEKLQHPLRVTVTFPFLRNIVDHSIVYAKGEEKKEIVEKIMAKQGSLAQIPALIIHEMKDVKIITEL